jgi:hypothetical protein
LRWAIGCDSRSLLVGQGSLIGLDERWSVARGAAG